MKREKHNSQGIKVINIHAAGIDVGTEKIFISVYGEPVRSFDTYTSSLQEAKQYLISQKVDTVAMESTGVYWIPIYEILEASGIKVCLVNGAHVKNLPGRKTDVKDCEWIRELHSYGLLRPSFIPDERIRVIRAYVRLRDDHIQMAASHIQHMQKALDMMNVKLHQVISQLTGVSGIRIIKAILNGERNSEKLVSLCESSILNKKRAEVIRSLEGNYKKEHLFALAQALDCWEFYQKKIVECDKEIGTMLEDMGKDKEPPQNIQAAKPIRHHKPEIDDLHVKLMTITDGKDVARLAGLTDLTVMQLISELGIDMSPWKTEKYFTSWLGLSPCSHSSGKSKKRCKIKNKNRAGQIFRESAQSVGNSKYLALGGFFRRIKSRAGNKVAIKATARKIAVLYYRVMKYGIEYVEEGLKKYEMKYKDMLIKSLQKKALSLGMLLVPSNV
jgi:transposase